MYWTFIIRSNSSDIDKYEASCQWKYVGKVLKCLPRDYHENHVYIQSGFDRNKYYFETMPIDPSYMAQDDETKAYLYNFRWRDFQERYDEQKKDIDVINRMNWYHLQHVILKSYQDLDDNW